MVGGAVNSPGIIANVYLSPVVDGYLDNEIEAIRMNIDDNSVQNFNMVLADFDQDNQHAIGIGTKFIINIPREWHTVVVDAWAGFEDTPTVTLHDDGSYQIVGITDELIGNINGAVDRRTISFHTTAPDVDVDRMYVMY